LYHIDSYRLEGAAEAWGIGLEDLIYSDQVVVIEWPEKIEGVLPQDRLWIALSIESDTQRRLSITATGERYQQLLETLQQNIKLGAI
jgi:tRNA threonylcarbamoyladenosine biosynthesis protein TsaE